MPKRGTNRWCPFLVWPSILLTICDLRSRGCPLGDWFIYILVFVFLGREPRAERTCLYLWAESPGQRAQCREHIFTIFISRELREWEQNSVFRCPSFWGGVIVVYCARAQSLLYRRLYFYVDIFGCLARWIAPRTCTNYWPARGPLYFTIHFPQ